MAGLLAWAADVVGAGNVQSDGENSIPIIFSPEQQKYVHDLDQKAAYLTRSIQDLRLRLPPPDISQSLPHLHAHSLASNAALALQLNAHSATREQVRFQEKKRDSFVRSSSLILIHSPLSFSWVYIHLILI